MQVNSEPTTRQAPPQPTGAVPPDGKRGTAVVGHQLSAGDAEKAAALRKMKLAALGEFVQTNFLSEQVVHDKLASLDVARKAGAWLSGPGGAERVAKEGAAV